MSNRIKRLFTRQTVPEGQPGTLGYLDSIEGAVLRGWAYEPTQLNRRVWLAVTVDRRRVAEEVADLPRADLKARGYGDGCYGFSITLPPALIDGRVHEIQVVNAETGIPLQAQARRQRLEWAPNAQQTCLDLLFDATFYQAQAGIGSAPFEHYRDVGWKAGHDPHPLFSTRHYHDRYGPLATDPLSHFAETGQWAGAWTHPLLDPDAASPISQAGAPPLHPVVAYAGGQISPERPLSRHFNDADYLARYPDVAESGIAPLSHYLAFGSHEGKRPHPDFDPALFARMLGLKQTEEPYTHFVRTLRKASPIPPGQAAAPAVSVIVLTHNKSVLTLQCLQILAAQTDLTEVEVIVVDNGSSPEEFSRLARDLQDITLVRLGANRGFGEANNIGAEHARGRLLVFLNNDAFVRPGWLPALRRALDQDETVGAAGAKMLYPDGSLQEAGAMISACGTAVQRGKHLDTNHPVFNRTEPVDYCSAALLMVRAESFRRVLGFDLRWDPAYYEDADLCLKLRSIGQRTLYVPEAEVVHLEHATSGDPRLALRLHDIVAINRLKFLGRWGDVLAGLPGAVAPSFAPARPAEPRTQPARTLALYTPYPLTPGGGERYLLTIAEALSTDYACTLLTPDRYSRLRLLTMGRELGLDLERVEVGVLSETRVDLFVCMANELLPPLAGLGRTNIYHCQFPFPMHPNHLGSAWNHLAGYHGVIVNSAFTAGHYAAAGKRAGLRTPPVHVLAPPVPQSHAGPPERGETRRILSIGRFDPGGHCKHQDRMIAEFARLLEQGVSTDMPPLELHLAGAVGSDSGARAYLAGLIEAARGLPVRFYPNATPERIAALRMQASLYWHLTGADRNVARNPELFEHFGIALAEAMSAGAVPVALGFGGPREIVSDGHDGVLIERVRDLAPETLRLLRDPARLARMSTAARTRAAAFAPSVFATRLRSLVAACQAEAGAGADAGR